MADKDVFVPGSVGTGVSRGGTLGYNPNLQMSTVKLDGGNYLAWSRSFQVSVQASGLSGYLTGTKKKPASEPELNQWISENSMVMTWLFNSMTPSISRGFLFLETASEIWSAASQTYSHVGNDAQVYELRKKVRETFQKNLSVSQYYAELTSIWQEMDYYQNFQADCASDSVKFQQLIEKERVYDFLAGLNMEFDQARAHVLTRDSFPSLRQAYAFVLKEESRRGAMLQPLPQDRSALAASSPDKSGVVSHSQDRSPHVMSRSDKQGNSDKDQLQCDYCGKHRHTRDHCWKLHGRPAGGRGSGRSGSTRSHAHLTAVPDAAATLPQGSDGLSNVELQTLRRLMARLDGSSSSSAPATSNFAHTGAGDRENDWQW